jgi:hypothetical protein
MTVVEEYVGRKFNEIKGFKSQNRHIANISSNNTWLNTVELGLEQNRDTNEFETQIIKLVRWRAINAEDKSKTWRVWRRYNIRSAEEWQNVSSIVNDLVEENTQNEISVHVPIKKFDQLVNALDEQRAFKKRISKMQKDIKDYEIILKNFDGLISDNNTTETDVHKYLVEKRAHWMFGLEYIELKKKVRIDTGEYYYESDLMLQRHDGFWDLVELKGPNENLFNKRTQHRSTPNRALSEAVSQVFTYFDAIDKMFDVSIVKPKAFIVIGKQQTDRPSDRRIFSSYLNNIELITYSELYQRGKRLIKYIKDIYPKK